MKIRNQKDFWSAIMFITFGVLFIVWSSEYQFGSTQRMGPGYFPTILGILLLVLGVLVALPSLKADAQETHVGKIGWRGLLVILGAVVLYALLLPRMGFLVALTVLVIMSAMGSKEFTWKAALSSVVVLGIFSYLVFVKGLSLQFPVFPTFMTQ